MERIKITTLITLHQNAQGCTNQHEEHGHSMKKAAEIKAKSGVLKQMYFNEGMTEMENF
jgi:hypothetical protein